MQKIDIGAKPVCVFLPEGDIKLKIWANMGEEDAQALFEKLGGGIALFAAGGYDWNADLSPWSAKACFKGGEDFAGRASKRLLWLESAVSQAESLLPGAEFLPRAIMGYSLAGLFALWAVAQCGLFDMAASVSGSLWFGGAAEFFAENAARFAGKAVYLSLGDREAKTRNPYLSCVERDTRAVFDSLRDAGADCVFELNPGNHFFEPDARCARAAQWLYAGVKGGR